ncbi:hypothetical protein C7S14_2014 [Burkholderia cepacia]|nr:hypothetical protein C7S14_2014 [Burkholderia cepacia]
MRHPAASANDGPDHLDGLKNRSLLPRFSSDEATRLIPARKHILTISVRRHRP